MKSTNNKSKKTRNDDPNISKMIMFSTGYFLNTFLIIAFNNYVWTFYEGELGLIDFNSFWPILMAIANTIFTIWSMIISPSIGYLTDKPFRWTKKRGFHTPWIIIGGISAIIFFFLLFTPPSVTGAEEVVIVLIYYIIFVSIYDLCFSLLQTHSFGAFAAHFRGDKVRRKAGIITQIFTFLANFLAITVFSLIITPGISETFTLAAFISLIILVISLLFFIPGSKETDVIKERFIISYNNADNKSFLNTMKMALKEKNFMLVVISYFSFMITLGLTSMNAVNYVDDALGVAQYIRSVGSIIMLISSFITMPLWARVAKRLGHSNAYAMGLGLYGVTTLFSTFIINTFQFYILSAFSGISTALFLIMLAPVTADCYDEIAVKYKKHYETTLVGVRNFFVKMGVPVQSFIIAVIHAITLYDPIETVHSVEALIGLRLIQGIIPSIICILGALIFFFWFDLKGERKRDIHTKLNDLGL